MNNNYYAYLEALKKPFKKIAKLEFLQPDNSIAFSLDNNYKRGYMSRYDSRAFIQDGALTVNLNNGQRRRANIVLSNLDDAFAYNVNKLWHGRRVRLSMGLVLPNGQDFYLPQGVFYLNSPAEAMEYNTKTMSYDLVDKYAVLDGTLGGILPYTYQIDPGANVFAAMASVLQLNKYDLSNVATNALDMLDNVRPVFTDYYNTYTYEYTTSEGVTSTVSASELAFQVIVDAGGKVGDIIEKLNSNFVGVYGYDPTGAFRVEPSQDDILDSNKPVLWRFSPQNSMFVGATFQVDPSQTVNDVIIVGESMEDAPVYGRATNYDGRSDTNVNIVGLRTLRDRKAEYWNATQCVDYADWYLKRHTVTQKAVTIHSAQMFHLLENRLVSIVRTDRPGNPVEDHLIQSFTLPIGETGEMNISAVSVNDFPIATKTATTL